jgi:hypothetical protein
VGFLRRRSNLETELAALQTRRDLLAKQLTTVEEKIAEATARRAAHLLEGDIEVPNEEPVIVERLRDERAATLDALNTIGHRIVEAESKLVAERDLAMRSTAAKELTAAADALGRVADEVAAAIAKVAPALDDVLGRLPLPHVILKTNVESFAASVVEALRAEVGEARAYIVRLTSGDAALVTPRPDDVKTAATPPIVERREVFLLGRSRWQENGETITSGPHCTASPPVEIAKLAIQHGHAIEAGSDLAITLQMRQPPSYANYAPADCLDIGQPKPLTKPPGSPTAALPLVHSEIARGRGGFATVGRNAR